MVASCKFVRFEDSNPKYFNPVTDLNSDFNPVLYLLNYHIKKKHVLDTDSGLHCFTCNKMFTKRDIIENHYKTVAHQIKCRKLQKEEEDLTLSFYF